MRIVLATCVLLFGLFGLTLPGAAAEAAWERDGAMLNTVIGAVRSAGSMGAVAPHAKAMKAALAGAPKLFKGINGKGDAQVILTDGQAETLAALLAVRGKGDVVAEPNPYPMIAMVLGSYYVETGKFKEAVKVLDAGLALSPLPKERLGATVPDLLSERGVALGKLKRWKEALANYDLALHLRAIERGRHAMLLRGRGFVLVELGRLDDAAKDYAASLKLEPGNAIAEHELAYIAQLQRGGKPTDSVLVTPKAAQGSN